MINNLQVLRALAALGVVFYHTDLRIFGVHTDFQGVSVFFVLSGFLMVHVTREDTTGFFAKRVVRIIPIYWILTIFAWIYFAIGLANPPNVYPLLANWLLTDQVQLLRWIGGQFVGMDSQIQAWALARSLFFLPSREMPILAVGWTLNIEMFFYAVFALSLAMSRKYAPLISSCVMVVFFMLKRTGDYDNAIIATYGHDYVIFFVFGIGIYYATSCIHVGKVTAATIGVVVAIGWLVASLTRRSTVMESALIHYLFPCAIVSAAVILHKAKLQVENGWLITFGGASYSLYLSHPILLETLRTTSTSWPVLTLSTPIGATIAIAGSCAVAVLIYRYIEWPLMIACRNRLVRFRQGAGRRIIPTESLSTTRSS